MKTAMTADTKAKADLVAADKFAADKKTLATTAKTAIEVEKSVVEKLGRQVGRH